MFHVHVTWKVIADPMQAGVNHSRVRASIVAGRSAAPKSKDYVLYKTSARQTGWRSIACLSLSNVRTLWPHTCIAWRLRSFSSSSLSHLSISITFNMHLSVFSAGAA